jgi:hypothetical protein
MSEKSFRAGAESYLLVGNVFLAFAEVKHATPTSIFTFPVS